MKPALVAALTLLTASPASAFTRSTVPGLSPEEPGPCLFWRPRDVEFVVNQRGSRDAGAAPTLAAVRASFETWNDVGCSDFTLVDAGTTDRSDTGYDQGANDNINLIVWREVVCSDVAPADDPCFEAGGCNNKYDCWDESPDTIAVTTTTFSNRTGEIFDADIEFNGAGFVFTTFDSPPCPTDAPVPRPAPGCVATDIENTLTHEAGHVIGLDHVDDPRATMYRSADLGETSKRTLAADDVEGLCAIYPSGGETSTCVADPVDVEGNGCGCGASGAAPGALVVPALFALRRRRPRR